MTISSRIKYIGVNDRDIDLFEGQFTVPEGMAYNSYAIVDEKCAVMDSVDARFADEWLGNIDEALEGKAPDYLIVQHMEPDHSGSILRFMEKYPEAVIAASARAFTMLKNFYGNDFPTRRLVLNDGSSLSLGVLGLSFITAPMVHWPEVIMSYCAEEKTLFSADAFGKFGALDAEEDWACEARRYYFGIVGKYGVPVQAVLKKAAALDIQRICPLHGPVLSENLEHYVNLYNTWSSFDVEEDGVMIAYTSVYGNTRAAVEKLAETLREGGCPKVVVNDLARCDWAEAVEDAFRYSKLVLATTTYNGGIFPFMREFIHHLTERNFTNRSVAFIENGSWTPAAARIMKSMFEKSKGLRFAKNDVKILSALNEESLAQLDALAKELLCDGGCCGEAPTRKFVCKLCGYVHEGEALPEDFRCPICRQGVDYFEEVN